MNPRPRRIAVGLMIALGIVGGGTSPSVTAGSHFTKPGKAQARQALVQVGQLPLRFETNRGQFDGRRALRRARPRLRPRADADRCRADASRRGRPRRGRSSRPIASRLCGCRSSAPTPIRRSAGRIRCRASSITFMATIRPRGAPMCSSSRASATTRSTTASPSSTTAAISSGSNTTSSLRQAAIRRRSVCVSRAPRVSQSTSPPATCCCT